MAKKLSEAERKKQKSEYMKRYWARKKGLEQEKFSAALKAQAGKAIVPATGNIVWYDTGPASGDSGGSADRHADPVDAVNHKTVTAARIALLDKVRSLVEANVISHGEAWSITERIFQ